MLAAVGALVALNVWNADFSSGDDLGEGPPDFVYALAGANWAGFQGFHVRHSITLNIYPRFAETAAVVG
jgi:hypothetical protein